MDMARLRAKAQGRHRHLRDKLPKGLPKDLRVIKDLLLNHTLLRPQILRNRLLKGLLVPLREGLRVRKVLSKLPRVLLQCPKDLLSLSSSLRLLKH